MYSILLYWRPKARTVARSLSHTRLGRAVRQFNDKPNRQIPIKTLDRGRSPCAPNRCASLNLMRKIPVENFAHVRMIRAQSPQIASINRIAIGTGTLNADHYALIVPILGQRSLRSSLFYQSVVVASGLLYGTSFS